MALLNIDIEHIHADSTLETHAAALSRLAEQFHVYESNLFQSHEEILAEVYRMQEERIAFEAAADAPLNAISVG